jgi:hypothetical protein
MDCSQKQQIAGTVDDLGSQGCHHEQCCPEPGQSKRRSGTYAEDTGQTHLQQ